jgi:hypothetical protein
MKVRQCFLCRPLNVSSTWQLFTMRSLSQPTGTFFQTKKKKRTYSQLILCMKSTDLTDNVLLPFQIKTLYPYWPPKQTLNTRNVSFNVRYSSVCSPLLSYYYLSTFSSSIVQSHSHASFILCPVSRQTAIISKTYLFSPSLTPLKLRLSCLGSAGYYSPPPTLVFTFTTVMGPWI